MDHDTSHLRHREAHEQTNQQQSGQTALEFATTEEMIRHDTAQIEVPSAIAERLSKSIAAEPKRSLLGRLRFWK